MKIKRLTAVLAVAAMAAGFTLASPMLSAQAIGPDNPANDIAGFGATFKSNGVWHTTTPTTSDGANVDIYVTVPQDVTSYFDIFNLLGEWSTTTGSPAGLAGIIAAMQANATIGINNWNLTCNGQLSASSTPDRWTAAATANLGTVYPETPRAGAGTGTFQTWCAYDSTGVLNGTTITFPYDLTVSTAAIYELLGNIYVTVQSAQVTGLCSNAKGQAVCLTGDTQAVTAGDKKGLKDSTITINAIKANYITAASWSSATSTGFIDPNGTAIWTLYNTSTISAVVPLKGANTQLGKTDAQLASLISYDSKNNIVFTPPTDWSGVIVYQYTLTQVDVNGKPLVILNGSDPVTQSSLLTITVHPTLTAPDDLTTDQGVAVTVPLLGKGSLPIIGTPKFQDAFCWFADTKNKTKDATFGSIKNAGGQANPVYTPAADFVGDVTLSCTVADKWDPISNTVSVVVHVGTPAPAPVVPVAPATPACDKTDSAGKCIISVTGGSLAAPMSSGLAAVVLLVAAGAGILVVRRRTALAG